MKRSIREIQSPQNKSFSRSVYGDFSEHGQQQRAVDPFQQSKSAQELMRQKIGQQLEYINKNINPILSKMMIKIINENPIDLVQYMIHYLKHQQNFQSKNQFQNQLSKTISPNKRIKTQSRITTNRQLKKTISQIRQE